VEGDIGTDIRQHMYHVVTAADIHLADLDIGMAESRHLGNAEDPTLAVLLQQFEQMRGQKSRATGDQDLIHACPCHAPRGAMIILFFSFAFMLILEKRSPGAEVSQGGIEPVVACEGPVQQVETHIGVDSDALVVEGRF
jgi:hypothetical protein